MGATPGIDDVRKNYNRVGIEIIEAMYANDYLSIGGVASTEHLAAEAGVDAESRILDVGSGLGGPALHLAQTFGARVTGIDLVDHNVQESTARAKARGLDRLVDFHAGDATRLPFEDACFDIVWGQDAWCHITDKDTLIHQCARVLEPGGIIAFTDWLVAGEMSGAQRLEILAAAASTAMATSREYRRLLTNHGFVHLAETDVTQVFVQQYRDIMAGLGSKQERITRKFSEKVFGIVAEKNAIILNAFENGLLGGSMFIAKKPAL